MTVLNLCAIVSSFLTLILPAVVIANEAKPCTLTVQCPAGMQCRQQTLCEEPLYTPPPGLTDFQRISAIQGPATVSPFVGQKVSTIGVVTAVLERSRLSYYIQDIYEDGDELTSEAIFSYAPTLQGDVKPKVGDVVLAAGKIVEFAKWGTKDLPVTEFAYGTIEVLIADADIEVAPKPFDPPSSISALGTYRQDPALYLRTDLVEENYKCEADDESAICLYEAREAMLVSVVNPVVNGPEGSYGDIGIVSCPDNTSAALKKCVKTRAVWKRSFLGDVIVVDDDLYKRGDRRLHPGQVLEDFQGVISYSFGLPRLYNLGALVPKESSAADDLSKVIPCAEGATSRGELRIGTFNLKNRDARDNEKDLEDLCKDIAHLQRCPDVLVLTEVGDNDGTAGKGTVSTLTSADLTLSEFADMLEKKDFCDTKYLFTDIAPEDDADGGLPGENIRVAMLYRQDKVQLTPGAPKGGPRDAVAYDSKTGKLTLNPGRVDPPSFEGSRKPLVAQFQFQGLGEEKEFIVIGNHWNSKGGDDSLFGRRQPPLQVSQKERTVQSEAVKRFLESIPKEKSVFVVGDLNDFYFSNPISNLGLTNLWQTLESNERFSYVYQHRHQTLDHILVRESVTRCSDLCVVHSASLQHYKDSISDHDAIGTVCQIL